MEHVHVLNLEVKVMTFFKEVWTDLLTLSREGSWANIKHEEIVAAIGFLKFLLVVVAVIIILFFGLWLVDKFKGKK